MSLANGTRLGPYEILNLLGSGGMGEVYRARDTRLERMVAVKILPPHFASSHTLRRRFEQEAQALSRFSHPNICHLYDIGRHSGVDYLVMEYLEGETLANRLQKGPLRVDQVLAVGIEVAGALEKAHRQGIVHRDLKPGNIMLTKGGARLMDFGLAKPLARPLLSVATGTDGSAASTTVAGPMAADPADVALTQDGEFVGTVPYMSPETIRGEQADERSDLFALGAVLYEALTARTPFKSADTASTARAILETTPEPIAGLRPDAPISLQRVVDACLARAAEDRLQTAHDLRLQLQWIRDAEHSARTERPMAGRSGRLRFAALAVTAGVLASLAIVLLGWALQRRNTARTAVIRFAIPAPENAKFEFLSDSGGPPQLSPDGKRLVFAARSADNHKLLWVRSLDNPNPRVLEGTENATFPFWSPDDSAIAFFAEGMLKKVPAEGGPVVTLCPARNPRGGSWGADGTILFAPEFRGGLWRVTSDGGQPTLVTKVDPTWHTTNRWPVFLPDGRHFLYFATNHSGGAPEHNGIFYGSLDGKENRLLTMTDAIAIYGSGYLLYHSGNALMARAFDPGSGRLSGAPRTIADNVTYDSGTWNMLATASQTGMLAFQSGSEAAGSELLWFDREGKQVGKVAAPNRYISPRLRPDGKAVAVVAGDPASEIFAFDLTRGVSSRITFEPASHREPAWSPDGKRLAYSKLTGTGRFGRRIYVTAADGAGKPELVTDVPDPSGDLEFIEPDWSPDGRSIVFTRGEGPTGHSIWATNLSDRKLYPLFKPQSAEGNLSGPRVSPDGKWIAFVSTDSGRREVFVTSFPEAHARWQISSNGGDYPSWRRDGKELYFVDDNMTLHAAVTQGRGSEFSAGSPRPLFRIRISALGNPFDASADGRRFLVNTAPTGTSTPVTVVVNWTSDLRK